MVKELVAKTASRRTVTCALREQDQQMLRRRATEAGVRRCRSALEKSQGAFSMIIASLREGALLRARQDERSTGVVT